MTTLNNKIAVRYKKFRDNNGTVHDVLDEPKPFECKTHGICHSFTIFNNLTGKTETKRTPQDGTLFRCTKKVKKE